MSFTRTKSGLKNYSKFYRVDITVFTEGRAIVENKKNTTKDLEFTTQTSDELFHQAILSTCSPHRKFKIKSVGSKTNVDAYAKKMRAEEIKNCILIYDSDYECVTSSWVTPPWMMRTYGYSWENDLWTPEICEDVIDLFSGGRNWDKLHFRKNIAAATRRAERLGRIEVICRTYGANLIIPKSNSVGIRLDGNCKAAIPIDEVNRVVREIKNVYQNNRNEIFYKQIKELTKKFDCRNLTRGHLWEAICVTIIVNRLCCTNWPASGQGGAQVS